MRLCWHTPIFKKGGEDIPAASEVLRASHNTVVQQPGVLLLLPSTQERGRRLSSCMAPRVCVPTQMLPLVSLSAPDLILSITLHALLYPITKAKCERAVQHGHTASYMTQGVTRSEAPRGLCSSKALMSAYIISSLDMQEPIPLSSTKSPAMKAVGIFAALLAICAGADAAASFDLVRASRAHALVV